MVYLSPIHLKHILNPQVLVEALDKQIDKILNTTTIGIARISQDVEEIKKHYLEHRRTYYSHKKRFSVVEREKDRKKKRHSAGRIFKMFTIPLYDNYSLYAIEEPSNQNKDKKHGGKKDIYDINNLSKGERNKEPTVVSGNKNDKRDRNHTGKVLVNKKIYF